jgi:hypothetical protein
MHRIAIVAIIVVAIMLAGCGGSDGGSETAALDDAAMAEPAPAGDEAAAEGDGAVAEQGVDTSAARGDAAGAQELPAVPGDRIVREGSMRVEVDEGGFDRAFNRVLETAARLGGTVVSSNATSDDEGLTSGTVTVRVPSDDYDALLTAIAQIGTVRDRSITSQDVSAEFVDLEARLRHNQAQERFYLSLLERAESVEDAIAVQQQVDDIQQAIEQIEGRLTYLEERTSFSRLTVELFEAGSAFQPAGAEPTFAHYWEMARNALVNVLGMALVLGTVLLPFAVIGLLIFVAVRRLRPARRRAVPATPVAPAETAAPESVDERV